MDISLSITTKSVVYLHSLRARIESEAVGVGDERFAPLSYKMATVALMEIGVLIYIKCHSHRYFSNQSSRSSASARVRTPPARRGA